MTNSSKARIPPKRAVILKHQDVFSQLATVDGKPKAFVFTIPMPLALVCFLFFVFFLMVKPLSRNGIPSSRCLQIKVNHDSVSSSLKAKGEEAPEKADQDFQSSLVVSASSSSIHSRRAQMGVLLASFICIASPLSVPLHLRFFHTYKHPCMSTAEAHTHQS